MSLRFRIACAWLLLALAGLPLPAANVTYRAVNVGRLGATTKINDDRVIIGATSRGGLVSYGYVYTAGVFDWLRPFGGTSSLTVRLYGLNRSGIAVGRSNLANETRHAVSYGNGVLTDLGTLGGNFSGATGITDAGQIVGGSALANGTGSPFVWTSSRMSAFQPTYAGGSLTIDDVNNAGDIVGTIQDNFVTYIYRSTLTATQITSPIRSSGIVYLGGSGAMVYSSAISPYPPVLVIGGQSVTLRSLNNQLTADFMGINAGGQVAGYCASDDGLISRACLFTATETIDLNQTVSVPGFTLTTAQAINDAGEIVCAAVSDDGQTYTSFLLLPPGRPPMINTAPVDVAVAAGSPASFSTHAEGDGTVTYQWYRNGTAIAGATGATLTIPAARAADAGRYTVVASNEWGGMTSLPAILRLGAAESPVSPRAVTVGSGVSATLRVPTDLSSASYQWFLHGAPIASATSDTLALNAVQPAQAGLYSVQVTAGGVTSASAPAIVGLASTAKASGAATVIATDILHANRNVYDQVLLQGAAATITADPGKVTRVSFVDLSDDIVQVEFSGPGALTINLDNASGPATPAKYNQPTVQYMKGHARLVLTGAEASTHVAVFTVGRGTAVNQALFRDDVTYDGVADIAYLAVSSTTGQIGSIRTANASYTNSTGYAGIYAPGVEVLGPTYVGDVNASGSATPLLRFARNTTATITGGDLLQSGGRAVQVSGLAALGFTAGATSHNNPLPVQANRGRLEEYGVDVTDTYVH